MLRVILPLLFALAMTLPANAQDALKSPLSYSLREYGVILGIAMLGGLARWYTAVRRGDTSMRSISALIGELVISAFAGLMAFWIGESLGVSPLLTAAGAGLAGHAGAAGIAWLERFGQRWMERRFGATGPAPLDRGG